jgi:hypothetical protein
MVISHVYLLIKSRGIRKQWDRLSLVCQKLDFVDNVLKG